MRTLTSPDFTRIHAGMPLTEFCLPADAADGPGFVVGIAENSVSAPGMRVRVAEDGDRVTIPDWTNVTGSRTLAIGEAYFLGEAGRITNDIESDGFPDVAQQIGIAVSADTMEIDLAPTSEFGNDDDEIEVEPEKDEPEIAAPPGEGEEEKGGEA